MGGYICKWDLDGQAQWVAKIDGTGSDTGIGISATCDSVYISGYYESIANVYNADSSLAFSLPSLLYGSFIVKYDIDGVAKWAVTIDDDSSSYGVSVINNSVYATGYFTGTANVKYVTESTVELISTETAAGGYAAYVIKIED